MFGSYNVLGKEKKHEKRCSDDDRLPVPLNIQSINISKAIREEQRETERERLTPWWAELKTECITEIISVFLVNFLIPKNPLSCWSAIVIAAPPMKPTTAACDRKSIRNPNLFVCRTGISKQGSELFHKDKRAVLSWKTGNRGVYLRIPSVACVTPAKKVAVNASLRYSNAFFTGSISFCSKVPSRSETTATGPMAMSLELPMKA